MPDPDIEPSPQELRDYLVTRSYEIITDAFAMLIRNARDFIRTDQQVQFMELLEKVSEHIIMKIECTVHMEPKVSDLHEERDRLRQLLARRTVVMYCDKEVEVITDTSISMRVRGPVPYDDHLNPNNVIYSWDGKELMSMLHAEDLLDGNYFGAHQDWIEAVHDMRCQITKVSGQPEPPSEWHIFRDAQWHEIPKLYRKAADRLSEGSRG